MEKHYNTQSVEKKWQDFWDASPQAIADPESGKKPFCIIMPPPNVTGSLHVGHALTFTLQDVLIRYHKMLGEDVLAQPGIDHAGIATQMMVEKQIANEGLRRQDIGREVFLKRVWQWKEESGCTIFDQLKKLGISAEWSRSKFTLDPDIQKAVMTVFCTLYDEGLLYKDKTLINWDPQLQTALSDLEVETREVPGKQWTLRYPLSETPEKALYVATTRPETLFADVAVAVHPDDARYKSWIGKTLNLPLTNRKIPIIADTYADPEKGTGAVKITPAHDFNDFEVGKRHELAFESMLDERACLIAPAPDDLHGMFVLDARKKVVSMLENQEFLEKEEAITHPVPYGDRSGTIVEPRLMDQWFVDAKALAKPVLEALDKDSPTFTSRQWKTTYQRWLENIEPWCISRQLWWGHRIPAWYGPDEKLFVALSEEEALKKAQDFYGKEVPLKQDEDVLDTWFSSALWPFATLGWPEKTMDLETYYPSTVMVTAFDIIFFWVARMTMMSMHFFKKIPFHTVYIHGLIRDEKGQKMSKTKGNVLDPLQMIDAYGTDALRFSLALLALPGRDIRFGKNHVETARNFMTKIWNAARFCLLNQATYQENFKISEVKQPLNQWLLHNLNTCILNVQNALDNHHIHEAASLLYHFTWKTFCDWYLEFSKTALESQNLADRAETQETTGFVLGTLCKLFHPITPFLTEEIWQALNQAHPLLTHAYPSPLALPNEKGDQINQTIQLISRIRSLRSLLQLPPAQNMAISLCNLSDEKRHIFQKNEHFLKKQARLEAITFDSKAWAANAKHPAIADIIDKHLTLVLFLDQNFDFVREEKRLEKEIHHLQKIAKNLQQRLDNPKFKEKADAQIIQETTLNLEKTTDKIRKIQKIHTSIAHLTR